MGLGRINADAISAQIIREYMVRDETGTVSEVADWAGCTTDEASHRLHNVLEPAGLVEVAGTKSLPDPLNDANVWRLTEDGFDWGMEYLEEISEKLLDERPGALVVEFLNRTETVEQHMDSVRGEFDSLSEEVEQLRENGVPAEAVERMGALEERVDDFEGRIDGLDVAVRDLQDDVEELQERFDRVIAEQY